MITASQLRQYRRKRKPDGEQDELKRLQEANEETVEEMQDAGYDTTIAADKPTFFDKVLGVLDAAGAPIRGLVYNAMQKDNSKDVDVLGEFTKALKGEDRLDGADLAELMGVENKWGQMGVGFAADVLLDPLTYLSGGLSAAGKATKAGKAVSLIDDVAKIGKIAKKADKAVEAGKLAGKYGDDIARIVRNVDNVSQLSRKDAREVLRIIAKQAAEETGQGAGLRFMGQEIPLTDKLLGSAGERVAQFSDKLELGSGAASSLYRSGKHIGDLTFGAGSFTEQVEAGNALTRLGVKEAKRMYAAANKASKIRGRALKEELLEAIPNDELRALATFGIGRQAQGDIDKLRAIKEAAKKKGVKVDRKDIERAMKLDADAFPKTVNDYMAATGKFFDGDELDRAYKAVDSVQSRLADNLRKQQDAGINAEFLLSEDLGSLGYVKSQQTRHYTQAEKEVLDYFGINADLLDESGQALSNLGTRKDQMKIYDQARKKYLNPEKRITHSIADGKGEIVDIDFADIAASREAKDYSMLARAELQDNLDKLGISISEPSSARAIQNLIMPFDNDSVMRESLEAYDKVMGIWKSSATSLNFPRFQIRNMYGNKYLQMISGLLDFGAEKDSWKLVGQFHEAVKNGKLHTLSPKNRKLYLEMIDNGLISANDDILGLVKMTDSKLGKAPDVAKGKLKQAAGKTNDWLKYSNEVVENQGRISAYLAARKKGLSASDAARAVDDALFSYSPEVMTAFENQVMKRLVPFYTWMRRNTPKAFETLVKNPRAIAIPQEAIANAQNAFNVDKDILVQHIGEGGYLPIFEVNGKPSGIKTDAMLPIADMVDLINSLPTDTTEISEVAPKLARWATQGMTPALKVPIELGGNFKSFYQQPIKSRENQKVSSPEWVQVLARALPNDYENDILGALGGSYMDRSKEGYADLMIDPQAAYLLENVNPTLNNIGKLLANKEEQRNQILGQLLGVKLYGYDERELQINKEKQIRKALSDIRKEAEKRAEAIKLSNERMAAQAKAKKGGK